jgi:uncharacterized Tic20 family protein
VTDPSASAQNPPPGWYPDPNGQTRWWDGQAWGAPAPATPATVTPQVAAPSDARSMAMLSHLLAIFTGFLGPLVIYLMNGRKDPFVRHHSSEALNFQITYTIALIVSIVAIFFLVGFLLFPAVVITALVFEIQGTIAANRGEWWRYPINIRMVPGLNGQ